MAQPRRALCAACLRPQSACICPWTTPTPHPTEVVILQHPLEAGHVKNTARLLHLSLPNSRLLVGETFDEASLHDAKATPHPPASRPARYTVLLYPPSAHAGHAAPAPLDGARLRVPGDLRLVVLDGTWRKSRKMLHQSPWLQRLPRLSLQDVAPSGYAIRKAHTPGQLSTLEATCAALAQLDGGPEAFRPLLQAFNGFIAQQQQFFAK